MPTDSSERFVRLNRLAEEFAERCRRGDRPSLQEYLDRHPELADDIREFFPALVEMEQVKEERKELPEGSPLPPLERLGDYRILREIGRGGMGIVYEAEQVSLGRHVALKVLPQKLRMDARMRQRFEREARAAAKLHHTNIVPVFGVGEHEGMPYYVMQFIPGLGLDKVLEELQKMPPGTTGPFRTPQPTGGELRVSSGAAADGAHSLVSGAFIPAAAERNRADGAVVKPTPSTGPAPLPASGQASDPSSGSSSSVPLPGAGHAGIKRSLSYWQSVAHLGVQVADALEYAHRQGIQHRDIKPSNLLLDTRGIVWVTDFGLAKAEGAENLTASGDVLGTLRYMAPEAFDGKTDARSDIYSLGLTLYELLALRPAFDAADRARLIKQVTTAEPTRLDTVNPAIPRDLVTIVQKAIAHEPQRRYATAGALAADLQRFLDDQPIQARRESALEQLARWSRHHSGIAASLAFIAVLLVAVAVGSAIAAWRFERLADEKARLAGEKELALGQAEEAADRAQRRGDAERWERYQSNIAAATGALQLHNSGAARTALDAAPREHRNWEWQYLHSQLDGARFVLAVPGGSVVAPLALSPSGRHIAVCCRDHQRAYLYDLATGRPAAVLRGHSGVVAGLAYRPDGKQLVTCGTDNTLRFWDPATGRELASWPIPAGPTQWGTLTSLVYSPDGSRLVYFVPDGAAGTTRLWDAAAGKELAVLGEWSDIRHTAVFRPDGLRVAASDREYVRLCDAATGRPLARCGPHGGPVACLAYSPDGKRIASGCYFTSYTIHLWDGASGKEVAKLPGHTAGILALHFSPDGSRLLSCSDYPDNTARLWDVATGRLLGVLAGHANYVTTFAFSPDGRRVATGSGDQTARLWDGRTGQQLAVLRGHTARIWHVAFSPDGTRVVTASDDATLRLWDATTGEPIAVLQGHVAAFECNPVFTPDGAHLVSGSLDGTVRVWDVQLLERNGILRGHERFVYDVAMSPDGEQVASAAWDGSACLWDATTGRRTGLLQHPTKIITAVAYHPDGRQLATVERDRGVTLWDVASGKAVRTIAAPAGYWLADTRVAFSPEGTLLAAGSADGTVRLWDTSSGREVAQLKGHEKCATDVAFHPDGSLLAAAGEDHTVRLWDVATREPVAVLRGHTDMVWRLAFSPDGELLASGSHDKTVRFWDAQTGESRGTIAVGSEVYGLAFSPDGLRLAAGCRDNTVRLFDVAARQQVAELRGHGDYVHAVAWSPDGTRLVSGSGDTTVRVWDALPAAVRARPPNAYVPPRGYVCYRAIGPIAIDGKLDEPAWQAVPWTEDFVDIEGDRRLPPRFRTRAKMLWDDRYFYIAAELQEPHVQGTFKKHDSYIFHEDNDFEVFLNPAGNNHNYAELELNALNTTWDLRLRKPYRDGGEAEDEWEIPGLRTAVRVQGTINNPRDEDTGWTIEIAIPWDMVRALNDKATGAGDPRQLVPRDGDQWRIDFSRVEWRFDIVAGKYVRRKDRREDNWVWSPQGVVNMHRPETWGYVQFSTAAPGQGVFHPDPAGPAKHVLHRIYHAQRAYREKHEQYAATLAELGLADLCRTARLEAKAGGFRARVEVRLPDGKAQTWSIREDSLVWPE
jgi:WD40 repeat protein/serine/threonine protein kinase